MVQSISAVRLAALVGEFDRAPAYVGLADAVTELISSGRVSYGTRLPSERDLTRALEVSRTTVTRAYAALRENGYAEARQGAGTFARTPGGPARRLDRALQPRPLDGGVDLSCSASTAPVGLSAAYAEAAADLPPYLAGHGYFPAGLPALQTAIAASYDDRGLPTDPDQVLVVPGALAATALVEQAFGGPGARVVVESPCYPNAAQALARRGARLVPSPVDPEGWDVDAAARVLRETRARLAFVVADFQNPTGHLMDAAQREQLAAALRRAGTVAVVDEAHVALNLDDRDMPPPLAAFAPGAITLGSASKSFWGGLRLGWVRAPHALVADLTDARLGMDLGSPVLEQLVLTRLLARGPVLPGHLDRLREQRAALVAALRERLPQWRFVVPGGGLALWCELPHGSATALTAEAERRGVAVTPGPMFAPGGGLDRFVRVPWTRPTDELERAVDLLAQAWEAQGSGDSTMPRTQRSSRARRRVMVA